MRLITFAPCCGASSGHCGHDPPPASLLPPLKGTGSSSDDAPEGGSVSGRGWEDASRNTATFAVSREHRAGQVRSGRLNRTGTRQQSGREEDEPGTGPHQRACRASLRGGPTITKKDNAGRRILDQPGRSL